jgi:predicted permease
MPKSGSASWTDHLRRDLRHAVRAIVRMPVLSTVVVLSLGVGIGVNTTVFSWIQAVVLKPIPGVSDASSFQLVEPRTETGSYPGMSWQEYYDLRAQLRSFQHMLAFRMAPFNVGEPPRTERSYAQLVSDNYFEVLGLRPALGRFFRPDEVARPGSEPVLVISHDYWQTRFSGSVDVLGRTLRVNGQELTIIGVAPAGFQGTVMSLQFDLWAPATLAPVLLTGSRELEDRGIRGYTVMGRLRHGTTAVEAQNEINGAMRQLATTFPQSNVGIQGEVLSFADGPRGPQRMFVKGLFFLQGVMLLLLLAVCGNTANLLLARASSRQREMGVRLALGAGRGRIVSLLLTENILLAVMGAILGAVIAIWGTQALRAVPVIGSFPVKFQTSLDAGGLAFSMVLGVVCGLAFGLAPAAQLSRVNPQRALRDGANTAPRSRMRNVLMGTEVALALVVLVVAVLFFRNFSQARDAEPGFQREGVLLAAYDLSGRNADNAYAREFASTLLDRLRALPGVEGAAVATSVPLDIHGMPSRAFALEGRARADAAQDRALTNTVSPGYFATMGIAVRAGRDFADLNDATAPPQAIVNEAFVAAYLPGAEAIGRRLTFRNSDFVIAGVVRDSRYDAYDEAPKPFIYLSYRDRPADRGEIHVRTRAGSEGTLAAEIRRVVRDLDASLPVYDVRTMNEHLDKNLFLRRIPARMFVVLGPLLLLLAAIGIYAVVAYTVAHRTTEIGVRLALGATARRVVAEIVSQSFRVIVIGAAAGWIVVLGLDRHIIPGRPIDLVAFVGVPVILLLVATLACWLPARRATRVDPVVALRQNG